jgi:hypothetical protein
MADYERRANFIGIMNEATGGDSTFYTYAGENQAAAAAGRAAFKIVGKPLFRMIHDAIDPIPDDEEYALQHKHRDKLYNSMVDN